MSAKGVRVWIECRRDGVCKVWVLQYSGEGKVVYLGKSLPLYIVFVSDSHVWSSLFTHGGIRKSFLPVQSKKVISNDNRASLCGVFRMGPWSTLYGVWGGGKPWVTLLPDILDIPFIISSLLLDSPASSVFICSRFHPITEYVMATGREFIRLWEVFMLTLCRIRLISDSFHSNNHRCWLITNMAWSISGAIVGIKSYTLLKLYVLYGTMYTCSLLDR